MSEAYHKATTVPPLLAELPEAPTQLFVRGDNLTELLKRRRVAIVGSRRMSPYGQAVTKRLARDLASRGVVIISGLAFGVDACAHRAVLDMGGQGVAVMACGLDQIYPVAHTRLGEELVAKGGVIISEYPVGTTARKHRFLERNRLIAGLAEAVIITEAAARSGTLNTAAHALNQGKPVLAVPGNITSPLSEGTNNLVKAGAALLNSVDDIFLVLGIDAIDPVIPKGANDQEEAILKLLADGIAEGTALLKETKLDPSLFNQTLTMLEINGKIKPLGNNHWAIQ